MNPDSIICQGCLRPWVGKMWVRKNGKRDWRCECGSKRKPLNKEDFDSFKYIQKEEYNVDESNDFGAKDYFDIVEEEYYRGFGRDKKILIISDLHSGAKTGLTPPEWFLNEPDYKFKQQKINTWSWFRKTVDNIGNVDALIVNGDCIDGKGAKSGGTELITSDLFQQVGIAERCIKEVKFKNIFFTYGTGYHCSSNGDDFEVSLADKFNTDIKDQLWLNVNNCVFDFKHKTGSSSVFTGRATSLLKEVQWNRELSQFYGYPKADVIVRSHVHYISSVSDYSSYLAMTTPALQIADTKFGNRECVGSVDFGMVLIKVPYYFKNVNDLDVRVFRKDPKVDKNESIII